MCVQFWQLYIIKNAIVDKYIFLYGKIARQTCFISLTAFNGLEGKILLCLYKI